MYDYTRDLDARAQRERKLWTEKGELYGRSWGQYNDGSAVCYSGSLQSALDAYAEYKKYGQ